MINLSWFPENSKVLVGRWRAPWRPPLASLRRCSSGSPPTPCPVWRGWQGMQNYYGSALLILCQWRYVSWFYWPTILCEEGGHLDKISTIHYLRLIFCHCQCLTSYSWVLYQDSPYRPIPGKPWQSEGRSCSIFLLAHQQISPCSSRHSAGVQVWTNSTKLRSHTLTTGTQS